MKHCEPVRLNLEIRSQETDNLDRELRSKIVGQDTAIESITDLYQLFLAGLNPPLRPIGNLLFLGPTGSGKTRVVEALAESLFGDSRACVKIDCAEFQHSHEIAKLIGSPPGYLGHRETHPMLTQETLNMWHTEDLKLSILLFDEIEKASDALWKLLLGILDKATLTLGDNRRVDLSQCIIIMTSNLGASEMVALAEGGIGFNAKRELVTDGKLGSIANGAAKKKFDPEFMNRIDKTVVFNSLQDSHLRQILEIELGMVQQRILTASAMNQFVFSCTSKFKDLLMIEGFDQKYGARHLKRSIEKNLVHPISKIMATNQVNTGDYVKVDVDEDGKPTFTKEGESAPVVRPRVRVVAASHSSDTIKELSPERQQYPKET